MSKVAKLIVIAVIVMSAVMSVHLVLAATPDLGLNAVGTNIGLTNTDPRVLVGRIIDIALGFLGVIAIGLIIYGGFLWMTAAGNEERIETAKKVLLSAVIGLIIILSAFAITTFILNRLLEATNGNNNNNNNNNNDNNPTLPVAGQPCGNMAFGVCTPTTACAADSFCGNDCDCHKIKCSLSLDPAVCQVDPLGCGNNYYCDPNCNCQQQAGPGESCDSNKATPECDALGAICNPNLNLFCDTLDVSNPDKYCKCETGDGAGQPCYADPTKCQLGQDVCSNGLSCDVKADKTSCTCQNLPVINWISPVGGFCAGNHNKVCQSDADCAGLADPTCDTQTPNGASGNIISIGGNFFGTAPGTVYFSDGSNSNVAGTPPNVFYPTLGCKSPWNDNLIIVVVPNDVKLKDGPIKIVTAAANGGKADQTDDDRGPKINNFVINTIVRPGICQISPDKAGFSASVFYDGVNFGVGSANFGSYAAAIAGINSSFLPGSGTTHVPNLSAGNTTTFVHDAASGQNSNYVVFTKTSEAQQGAFISSFEPGNGPPGQYVTIRGNGFGSIQGTSKVYFGNKDSGTLADFDFPAICLDSIWSDKQIIVKVPQGISLGNFILTIVLSNGQELTTDNSTPKTFQVDNSALKPSLCKISPVIGQPGTKVNLWGEYFDVFDQVSSIVRFFSNRDASGTAIIAWDGNNKPNSITTTVLPGSATGLVRVVNAKNPQGGNGLNFSVGSCLAAADPKTVCGTTQYCCPASTYKAGACVDNLARDCAVTATTSVYEFDFGTNIGTGNTSGTSGSCQEKSQETGTCNNSLCPNSPGACSLFSPTGSTLQSVGVACDNSVCGKQPGCESNACVYASNPVNKCVDKNGSKCGLASTTIDDLGKSQDVYCSAYLGADNTIHNYYMYSAGAASCSKKYGIRGVNEQKTAVCVNQNSSCLLCANSAQSCEDDGVLADRNNHLGVCGSSAAICPAGSVCNSGLCKKSPTASCSCCCHIANSAQDCCAGLTCEGECGMDKINHTNTYGSCSGCTRTTGGAIDQTASDAACNCTGTNGKYCDVSADGGKGVCGDCAELTDANDCSLHTGSCCVDHTKGDSCINKTFGSDPADVFGIVTNNNISYCGYYQCAAGDSSCAPQPTWNPANTHFTSSSECENKCKPVPQAGNSCAALPSVDDCNKDACGYPLACWQSNGDIGYFNPGPSSETCGVCCCNPIRTGQCDYLSQGKSTTLTLKCQPNVGPCTGSGRGLCCGCTKNDDCVPAGLTADTQGCGVDTCCRTRPNVTGTEPVNGATGVCTNSSFSATFDQTMNVSSFNKNVVVLGHYFTPCPPAGGATPQANNAPAKNNFVAKLASQITDFLHKNLAWIFGKESLASFGGYYCPVKGTISGKQGAGETNLIFTPSQVLDPGIDYYVIIQGVNNLSDNTTGVLSFWGIGMNASNSPVPNSTYFIDRAYPNSYIWSFTTKASNGEDNGICAIDHVKIIPDSYLINVATSDLNENDTDPSSKTFDTANDNDKAFYASALSVDNQVLHPVSGYSWNWNWENSSPAVAVFINNNSQPFGINDSSQLVRAVGGVVDDNTKIKAIVNLTEQSVTNAGNNASSTADVYVFICTTPWPDKIVGAAWYPWRDQTEGANCLSGSGNCQNMNYALYYCRDTGDAAKTLPTVAMPVTTRGTNLGCTDTGAPADSCNGKLAGASCGANGGTCQDLLKESYFFSK